MLHDIPPTNTPPPGGPSGGVVYLRIVLSPKQASRMCVFLNICVLHGGVVSTSPNPQAGGPPLVGCPRLLIKFIRSYPPYRRPFLYPQPEDAPCRGDREPLHGLVKNRLRKHDILSNFPPASFSCPTSLPLITHEVTCTMSATAGSHVPDCVPFSHFFCRIPEFNCHVINKR